MRAGIQKALILFVYSVFRISFTSGERVRYDDGEVLCHSLKMMGSNSFMNIMPSPNAIQKALTAVAGGSS